MERSCVQFEKLDAQRIVREARNDPLKERRPRRWLQMGSLGATAASAAGRRKTCRRRKCVRLLGRRMNVVDMVEDTDGH